MVIKDTQLRKHQWDSKVNFFAKDPNNPDSEERTIPNEVLAMYRLRPLAGSDSVVQIRNWRIATAERTYRIYL